MKRTTREEHSRICEQCRRMEVELERLRSILNDAEDQVKKLEVKMFPGRNRMLKDAAEREADARAAYSEVQHRLDDIKRQERLLRMKMRREESEISVDDIPEVSTIGEVGEIVMEADVDDIPEVDVDDIPEAEISDVPVIEMSDMNMPEIHEVEVDEPVSEKKAEPTYCKEDHASFEKLEEQVPRRLENDSSGEQYQWEIGKDGSGEQYQVRYGDEEDVSRADELRDELAEQGKKLWSQAKKTWRVLNKMDVPANESLRLEIMSQVYEIEGEMRAIRDRVGKVNVLGAMKATNDLSTLRPKIQRLSHLVDSASEECPQIYFPTIIIPDANGFSLMEDVLSKNNSENHVSTAEEIDKFLNVLSKLKTAVKKMPERPGVVDQL